MAESRFAIKKLGSDNYFVWKYKMEMLLIKEGLWDYVNGAEKKPDEEFSSWIAKDNDARATIALSVDDNQLQHIRKATSSMEAWNSLKNYHERNTLSNKVQLMRQICSLRVDEGGNVEKHIADMMNLFERLSAIGEEKLSEQWSVAMLLSSLPRSYDTLITALETRAINEKDLTFNLVQSKLLEEYRRRENPNGEQRESAVN